MANFVAFRAFLTLLCISGHLPHIVYTLSDAVSVATGPDLLAALGSENISKIMLLDDIVIENLPSTPVQITSGRNVTLIGPGAPQLSGPAPLNTTGAAVLNFSYLFPVIEVNANATLILQNLIIKGIPNRYGPEFLAVEDQFLRLRGLKLYPSILPDPDSTVIVSNVLSNTYGSTTCSEDYLQRLTLQQASILGGVGFTGCRAESKTIWVMGWHNLTLGFTQGPLNDIAGHMNMIANGTGWQCIDQPIATQQLPQGGVPDGSDNDSDDDSISTGEWVAIGIGIALAVIIAGLGILFFRRLRPHRPALQVLTPPPFLKHSGDNYDEKEKEDSEKSGITSEDPSVHRMKELDQQYQNLAMASALKIRFGNVEGLEIGHLIGRGAHGRIYKGSIRGAPVAVKVVEHAIQPGDTAACENITSEAVLLTTLAHPNIVRVFRVATVKLKELSNMFTSGRLSNDNLADAADEADLEAGRQLSLGTDSGNGSGATTSEPRGILGVTGPGLYETWLVMEFCEKGSLYGAMKRKKLHKDGVLDHSIIMKLMIDVAEGMEFLHSGPRAVLHGDLKPANILLKAGAEPGSVTAVVADFGLSRMLDSDDKHSIQRTASLGTFQYMSPELLTSGRLTRAADVWAFGIMLIEVWNGESAFGDMTAAQVFYSIAQLKQLPKMPEGCPEKYKQLIEGCLKHAPEERIDFKEILEELREISG